MVHDCSKSNNGRSNNNVHVYPASVDEHGRCLIFYIISKVEYISAEYFFCVNIFLPEQFLDVPAEKT